jgi:hypothetical protein
LIAHDPEPFDGLPFSRYHNQMDEERSFSDTTTLAKP